MKILALQGSPRPKKYTQMVLDKFLEGVASKGAEFEIIFLAQKKIKPCTGCYHCWFNTPGVCIHKDDMPEILEKMKSSDVWVWATPLYHFGMTAYTKLCLERTMPLVEPFFIETEGVTTHPARFPEQRAKKMVLISVCGFPEVDNFTALVENFRLLCRAGRRDLAGVLLRPGAESMAFIEKLGEKGEEVLLPNIYVKAAGVVNDPHAGGGKDAYPHDDQKGQEILVFIFFPPGFGIMERA